VLKVILNFINFGSISKDGDFLSIKLTLQNIIVIILVIAAFSYIARRSYHSFRHDGTKEGCEKCDEIKQVKKT